MVPALVFDAARAKALSAWAPRSAAPKIFFRAAAWISLVFALSGFSWGTRKIPVQKNGAALSLVFDISWSMDARDSRGGLSRLESAAECAISLLESLDGVPVSVTLAKGEGVAAIPLSSDTSAARALVESLSPRLMSAAGTSLEKGVLAALKSFPENSARKNFICLFTDGDETEGSLSSAAEECAKNGVEVWIAGFGSESGAEVLAGDGRTKAFTALREKSLREAAGERYFLGGEKRSGEKLLSSLRSAGGGTISFREIPADRRAIFLSLAILFLLLDILCAESKLFGGSEKKSAREKFRILALCLACALSLCSCGAKNMGEILTGAWAWRQGKNQKASANFLRVAERAERSGESEAEWRAKFDLAATFISMGEDAAALKYLSRIPDGASGETRFAAAYNLGVVHFRALMYAEAARDFKKALEIDGTKIEAKKNLELSRLMAFEKTARADEKEAKKISGKAEGDAEDALFSAMREIDRNRWKSKESSEWTENSLDY